MHKRTDCNISKSSVPAFVENVKRKVMLYDCGNNIATVVDYMRKLRSLPYELIVPVYPEKDDMRSAVVRAGRSPFSSLREKLQEKLQNFH